MTLTAPQIAASPLSAPVWPINSRPGDVVMLDVPTDILCSYHYFQNVDMGAVHSWGTRIIGDSGAFSAATSGNPIDRETFHEWAARWDHALFWTAALDVIGDQPATQANWKAAQDDGLDLVPTVHYGSPAEALDWYVDRGADFIGLGGMVSLASEPDRLMRWLIPMFKRARDNYPHVRFHGWGISHPRLVDRLPWWSCDSSGFASAFRFGTMRLFDPRRGVYFQVDLNGRDIAAHRHLLARYYGVTDWTTIASSTAETRREVGRVAIKAVQLYAAWLQERQKVTPPASLLARNTATGPKVSSVLGYPGTAQMQAIESGEFRLPLGSGPAAAALNHETMNPLNPARGPLSALATGAADGSNLRSLNPTDGSGPDMAGPGPRLTAAMGAPAMQPIKALDPDDRGPVMAAAGKINTGASLSPLVPHINPEDLGLRPVIAHTQPEFVNPEESQS